MKTIINACNKVVNYKPFSPNMGNPGIKYHLTVSPDKARDKMKSMVHFNATRKKAVKRFIKVQYSAIFPTKTNTNNTKKSEAKNPIGFTFTNISIDNCFI